MKKIILLIAWILLLTFDTAGQNPKSRILGVVMGISKYQNVPSLKYADRDAMSFYNFLLSPSGGGADTNNIRLLLNEKATSYNFFEAMDNLLDMAKEGDQVYIYFAGHGDIEKKTDRQNGFLIGYNAPSNCYAAGGCIGVRYLQDYVETLVQTKKSKVTMIIDACRSGKLAGGAEGVEVTALALKTEWKGVTKILSCQPGETSLEGEKWGGGAGVFTYFMLKGMLGQADKDNNQNVSLMELSYYLDENVAKETGNKQLPEVVGDKRQELVRVNKNFTLGILNQLEKPITLPADNQSAGFETDLAELRDISVLKAYEKFRYYIKNDNLIAYNDSDMVKETALSIYRSLEGRSALQPLISKMKGELLAALQNRAQIKTNDWLAGIEKAPDSINGMKAQLELKTAFDMVDSTYLHYNQIKYKYLFWSSFDEKDDTNMIKILEECINTEPNEPFAHLNIGICYSRQKNYEKALYHTDKAIELSKNWSWPFSNKGAIFLELGKFEEAIKYLDKALEILPNNYKILLGKGNALRKLGKIEEAKNCYNLVTEFAPDSISGWRQKGLVLNKLGNFEEALICFDKITKLKPYDFEAWLNKGAMLKNLNRNEEAIKCYDRSLELNPKLAMAWSNKGVALVDFKKYEESVQCFDKSIEIDPKWPISWRCRGLSLNELGKYEEAIKSFDKAIELSPTEFESWFHKGIAYFSLEKLDDAFDCFDTITKSNPKEVNAITWKGKISIYQDKLLDAIRYYEGAIEIDSNMHIAWNNKGFALNKLKKYDEAIACYEKAIKIKPDFVDPWRNKGTTLKNLGKYDEAIKLLIRAIELSPEDEEGLFNMVCTYSLLKNKGEMLKSLKKVIQLYPKIKENAKTDEDFKEYWNDQDFIELVK